MISTRNNIFLKIRSEKIFFPEHFEQQIKKTKKQCNLPPAIKWVNPKFQGDIPGMI